MHGHFGFVVWRRGRPSHDFAYGPLLDASAEESAVSTSRSRAKPLFARLRHRGL